MLPTLGLRREDRVAALLLGASAPPTLSSRELSVDEHMEIYTGNEHKSPALLAIGSRKRKSLSTPVTPVLLKSLLSLFFIGSVEVYGIRNTTLHNH